MEQKKTLSTVTFTCTETQRKEQLDAREEILALCKQILTLEPDGTSAGLAETIKMYLDAETEAGL
jgi:hypothetical protein